MAATQLKRLGQVLLLSAQRMTAVLAVLMLALWVWLAQPSLTSHPPATLSVVPERLRSHVETLSISFHPRNYQHPANLDRSADYIRRQFEQAGAQVREQVYNTWAGPFRNVIGVFGVGQGHKYVIGAHYDSAGLTPGADDNASGVAGLIELAVLLGKHGSGGREIELVAWSTEEPPFFSSEQMGSHVHAAALEQGGEVLAGAISLEMIGYFSDAWGSQRYPLPGVMHLMYPMRGNFIAVVGSRADSALVKTLKKGMQGRTAMPVYSMSAPAFMPGIGLSDHMNYWRHGYPAVMITDTAFERNHEYHAADTADRLDYRRMAQVVVAVYEAVGGREP